MFVVHLEFSSNRNNRINNKKGSNSANNRKSNRLSTETTITMVSIKTATVSTTETTIVSTKEINATNLQFQQLIVVKDYIIVFIIQLQERIEEIYIDSVLPFNNYSYIRHGYSRNPLDSGKLKGYTVKEGIYYHGNKIVIPNDSIVLNTLLEQAHANHRQTDSMKDRPAKKYGSPDVHSIPPGVSVTWSMDFLVGLPDNDGYNGL
ncbi:hypothetical protein ACTA71_007054 [Dictyostelium dimigraforme]